MIRVTHLVDDTGLGGVTRVIADHTAHLSNGFVHEVRAVDTAKPRTAHADGDVVVLHFTVNWAKLPFVAALRAQSAARLVLVEHSYTGAYERLMVRNHRRFRRMLRLNYALVHQVVAVSRAQGAWLAGMEILPARKLSVIPQARDTAALAAVPPVLRQDGPLRLGAYGRYTRQKGFDLLIEAMRAVSPSVVTLHLAGLGPDQDALRDSARDLPHVQVGGPVTDLPGFLAGLDAVAVPSRWEAFGLVAQEARAAGRPVLAARTDGLTEQIAPDAGLLCESGSPDALAAAIRVLACRDVTAMGQAARRSAAGSLDAAMQAWRTLLTAEPETRAAPLGVMRLA